MLAGPIEWCNISLDRLRAAHTRTKTYWLYGLMELLSYFLLYRFIAQDAQISEKVENVLFD